MLDVLIIGSGPAGLSAAVYARRAGLEVVIAEKEYLGTGQIADSSQVDNYLGMPGVNGYDLGMAFREHAEKLDMEFYEGETVRFEPCEKSWKTYFDNGEVLASKTIIYAAGAFHRNLGARGEEQLMGKGISYCAVCDGAFYAGKDVAVIGGGDTALDDALYLSEICHQVYLVHRRDEFRGSALTVERLKNKGNVEFVTSAVVEEVLGEDKVSKVCLSTGRELPVNGVFVAVGMVPRTKAVEGIVQLDEQGYIKAGEMGETSAQGFFAAGDVRTKRLRQVVTAVSDGANAATSAVEYINTAIKYSG